MYYAEFLGKKELYFREYHDEEFNDGKIYLITIINYNDCRSLIYKNKFIYTQGYGGELDKVLANVTNICINNITIDNSFTDKKYLSNDEITALNNFNA